MAIKLPQSVKKVLQDKAYGHVVTFNADGKPQLTMVWLDADGDEVLFNTAEGRLKPKNLRRDPRVMISVQDRNDPQAYMLLHGKASVTGRADGSVERVLARTQLIWLPRRGRRGHDAAGSWVAAEPRGTRSRVRARAGT